MAASVLQLVPRSDQPSFSLASLSGVLSELSAGKSPAVLTAAIRLVAEAQAQREPVAWVCGPDTIFYGPDVYAAGVDLDAVAVVQVPSVAAPRAAELLLRSGGFGLIVIDAGPSPRFPVPMLSRMLGLAQKHGAAVIFLTEKPESAPSIDSLISMRAEVNQTRLGAGRFSCSVRAIKDKRRSPTWNVEEVCRGPVGVR